MMAVLHVEGKVRNELVVRPPDAIDLWEEKRHYDARFSNRFETAAGGTRFTVRGDKASAVRFYLEPVDSGDSGATASDDTGTDEAVARLLTDPRP